MMKKTIYLFLLIFGLQNCSIQSTYSKNDALVQSFHCLKIKEELGAKNNLRDPYFHQLAGALKSGKRPDKSVSDMITILSLEIEQEIKADKELIDSLIPKHKDSRFFEATREYLELFEKLEVKTQLLFNSLMNPNSDKNEEFDLSLEIKKLAHDVLIEQTEYKNKESKFHNDNSIVQREVDSIVSIIQNK